MNNPAELPDLHTQEPNKKRLSDVAVLSAVTLLAVSVPILIQMVQSWEPRSGRFNTLGPGHVAAILVLSIITAKLGQRYVNRLTGILLATVAGMIVAMVTSQLRFNVLGGALGLTTGLFVTFVPVRAALVFVGSVGVLALGGILLLPSESPVVIGAIAFVVVAYVMWYRWPRRDSGIRLRQWSFFGASSLLLPLILLFVTLWVTTIPRRLAIDTIENLGAIRPGSKRGIHILGKFYRMPARIGALSKGQYFRTVDVVVLAGDDGVNRGTASLAAIGDANELILQDATPSESAWEHVGQCNSLSNITLFDLVVNNSGIRHLAKLANLAKLDLGQSELSDDATRELLKLSGLQSLHCSNTRLHGQLPLDFSRLNKLEDVYLFGPEINDEALKSLARLPRLTTLYLHRAGITDAGLEFLSRSRSLAHVSLIDVQVSGAGMLSFKNCVQLTLIAIARSRDDHGIEIDGHCVTELARSLPNAEIVLRRRPTYTSDESDGTESVIADLSFCELDEARLETLRTTKGITHLNLAKTEWQYHLSEFIPDLSELESLDLSFATVPFDLGMFLSQAPSLQVLRLRGIIRNLTAFGLGDDDDSYSIPHLQNLKQLRLLDLGYSGMDGRVLDQVRKLASLTHLDLSAMLVDDIHLDQLRELKQLEVLSLAATPVTDVGLAVLSQLANLKELDVQQSEVTADGIKKLNAARPDIKVIFDDNWPAR